MARQTPRCGRCWRRRAVGAAATGSLSCAACMSRERLTCSTPAARRRATNGVRLHAARQADIAPCSTTSASICRGRLSRRNPADTEFFSAKPNSIMRSSPLRDRRAGPALGLEDPGLAALLEARRTQLLRRQVAEYSARALEPQRENIRSIRDSVAAAMAPAARSWSTARLLHGYRGEPAIALAVRKRPTSRRALGGVVRHQPAAPCRTRSRTIVGEVAKAIPATISAPHPQRHRAGGGELVAACRRARQIQGP